MENTLLTAGIACIMAAIVGGGLKAFGVEIPAIQSRVRQGALAALGLVLIVIARAPGLLGPSAPALPAATAIAAPATAAATAPVAQAAKPTSAGASGAQAAVTPIATDGTSIAVRTNGPGQVARMSFAGRAGQRVTVVERSIVGNPGPSTQPGCITTTTRLLAPDGREAASDNSCSMIPAVLLPTDGTYIIELSAPAPDTVDLSLALFDVPPDLEGVLQFGGPAVPVVTAAPGQRARLTFQGRAGQRFGLIQRNGTGSPGPSIAAGCLNETTRVLRSDGQEIATTSSCAALEPTRLPADGTYAVEVTMIDPSTADMTIELYEAP
ncbi:MAG TPA: hypothetical protein VGL99_07150 [Chloroflexota bacterium]